MKRILFLAATILLLAGQVNAQQHEIGAVAGGLNGASYKYWFSESLALQADLAVGLSAPVGRMHIKGTYSGIDISGVSGFTTYSSWDFMANPNVAYHWEVLDNFFVYAGGGTSIGFMGDLTASPNYVFFKWGLNALGGVEYKLSEIPLALAFDFRPGYAISVDNSTSGVHKHINMFDWKLAVAVRYCL